MNNEDLVNMATRMPMVEWGKIAQYWIDSGPGFAHFPTRDNRGSMDDAVRQLDGLIQMLVRLRAYLEYRSGDGCGDQGHARAIRAQNRLVARVRKVLGYTYSKQDVTVSEFEVGL